MNSAAIVARLRAGRDRIVNLDRGQIPALAAILVKVVGAFASFGVTFLIAAEFGAKVVGTYALFTQTLLAFSMFAVFGNDHVIVRGVAANLAKGRLGSAKRAAIRCLRSTLLVAAGIAIGCLALGYFGVSFGFAASLFVPLAIGLCANAILVLSTGFLRGVHRVILGQVLTGFIAVLMLVFVLALPNVELGAPEKVLPIAYSVAAVLAAGLGTVVALRIAWPWPNQVEDEDDPVAHNQFKLGAISTLNFAVGWIVLLTVGLFFGEEEAGVFRVCMQFNTLLMMVIYTYQGTLAPTYAKHYALKDFAGMRRLLLQSQIVLSLICGLPALIALIFAPQILGIMGEEFTEGAFTLRVLILAALSVAISGSGGALLNMSGREGLILNVTLAGGIIQIALVVIGAGFVGLEAAAVSYFIAFAIRSAAAYWLAQRYLSQQWANG